VIFDLCRFNVSGIDKRNRNVVGYEEFPQGLAVTHDARLARTVGRRICLRLQPTQGPDDCNPPPLALAHHGERRCYRDGYALKVGAQHPGDVIDRFHVSVGSMPRKNAGVGDEKIDIVLGVDICCIAQGVSSTMR